MDQITKTASYIRQHQMISPGDCVILAVSGGVDSVVMTHILFSLKDTLQFTPVIASFDHHLRKESGEEILFVEKFARSLGLRFVAGGEDIAALSHGSNVEDVARRARYRFLRHVAVLEGASAIATAHHQDDQAETVLLHLLRGSGSTGLAGISPKHDGLIRPLLCLSREEIMDYAEKHGLEYRVDASNSDPRYLRNKVRLELIPTLRTYNEKISHLLEQTAELCREEDLLLADMAENALADLWDDEACALSVSGLQNLPLALRRRVIRKAYVLVAGDGRDLSFKQVESVLELKEEQIAELPGGLLAYRRGLLYFARSVPPLPVYEDAYPLIADGCWHTLGSWGWEYQVTENGEGPGLRIPSSADGFFWRTRKQGDRVPSSGKQEWKKIKDLFIDEKIPPYQRNSWPVLVSDNEIFWIPKLWRKNETTVHGKGYLLIKIRRCDKI